jgi:O-antigen/teichoic acid export membrane protein
MLSGFATVIYLRIDQIMIEHLLGSDALGRYSAGVKLAEVASFFPGIIAYVLFPTIIEAYKVSAEKAEIEAIKLYRLMYAAGFAFSLFMTFAGDWLAHLLFGAAYEGAGPVLRVYVWSTVFVFLTIASQAQLLSNREYRAQSGIDPPHGYHRCRVGYGYFLRGCGILFL